MYCKIQDDFKITIPNSVKNAQSKKSGLFKRFIKYIRVAYYSRKYDERYGR